MRLFRIIILSFFISLVFLAQNSYAQRLRIANLPRYDMKKYHFGFVLAMNQMLFSLEPSSDINKIVYTSIQVPDVNTDSSMLYAIKADPTLGFTIGIVSNLRLAKYFDLRFIPSLAFGERELEYSILAYNNSESDLINIIKKIPSTYVELPLEFKFKSQRINNTRAYVLTGVKYCIDLASQLKKRENNENIIIKLKKDDINFEVGVGFDFYTMYFKFGTEIKMSYGINDLIKKENNIYTNGIENLSSKIFQLSFTFE